MSQNHIERQLSSNKVSKNRDPGNSIEDKIKKAHRDFPNLLGPLPVWEAKKEGKQHRQHYSRITEMITNAGGVDRIAA